MKSRHFAADDAGISSQPTWPFQTKMLGTPSDGNEIAATIAAVPYSRFHKFITSLYGLLIGAFHALAHHFSSASGELDCVPLLPNLLPCKGKHHA